MEKKMFQPNDNVFVLGDEYGTFHGANGIVRTANEKKVVVHFGREFRHIFGFEYDQGKSTWEFEPKALKKFVLEEYPTIRANRVYGKNMFHHLYSLSYKFSPENDCMYSGCSRKAHRRIIFNIWGSVCEYDVCEEHANSDGRCGDSFNVKKNYVPVVKNV